MGNTFSTVEGNEDNDDNEGAQMKKAVGGKVWEAPKVEVPTTVRASGPPCNCQSWVAHYFWRVMLPALFAIPVTMMVFVFSWTVDGTKSGNSVSEGFKEEYGYTKVEVQADSDSANVHTAEGQEKSVGLMVYKGVPVLYETSEQAYERMQKIDDGSYSEHLMEDYNE